MVFGYFLGKYLKDFYKTRSEHRENRYEADAKDRRWTLNEKFVKFYSKLAKIDQIGQILWMIQKKIFFLSKFQNGPIRKVNMLKSKFDDIFVPAALCHNGSALRKFFDQKKSKKFFSSTQNGPIRKVNRLKSKFDDIFVHEIFIKKLNTTLTHLPLQFIAGPQKSLLVFFDFSMLHVRRGPYGLET